MITAVYGACSGKRRIQVIARLAVEILYKYIRTYVGTVEKRAGRHVTS